MFKNVVNSSLLVMAVALMISACQPATAMPVPTVPSDTSANVVADENDLAVLTGTIYAAGSSTVYPLIEAVAENFKADGFSGEIKIDSIGSGGGFERFCKTGETDIANASRGIKSSEVESCAAIGRTPIEFRVGTDAIAVVVSKENTFLQDVTLAELDKIFTGDSEFWSDVRPEWPNKLIQRFIPGTDSGTFEFFSEFVVQEVRGLEELDDAKMLCLEAKNQQGSEDDNVLVQGVLGSPYAIGYFGFAYYKNNEDKMNAISIDGVAPNAETAESGEYVLSRPLFIYSSADILKEKQQVALFIEYFLDNVNYLILDVGYFPASQATLDASISALQSALQ